MIVIAIRPDVLTDADEFQNAVEGYAESVRSARPIDGGGAVRMPFDRSRAERRRRLDENAIDVADAVHATLLETAATLD